ncbi:hypothetical protein Y1Q_0010639 [Alligator mississippiensis]|uniref:Uncharacterized protein n=1 Tax=Alligator mississippiensis TaxID=8496 RepID=A0A151M697_ALLMI|nr:hypothetical protein Y1Q_0010639 [Alligator mississippiensis]
MNRVLENVAFISYQLVSYTRNHIELNTRHSKLNQRGEETATVHSTASGWLNEMMLYTQLHLRREKKLPKNGKEEIYHIICLSTAFPLGLWRFPNGSRFPLTRATGQCGHLTNRLLWDQQQGLLADLHFSW